MKKIHLGGGCFWGMEEYFKRINGVLETSVGYGNCKEENPSYEMVCTGKTNAVEIVGIKYNESIISLSEILDYFWKVIDPISLNKQGNDIGTQYRTGIYYTDEKNLEEIENSLKKEQEKYDKIIVTEVKELENYFLAEEYHQEYLRKNPNGYCHIKLN